MTGRARREVPAELRRRYLRAGWWTDEALGTRIDAMLRAGAEREMRIWSRGRPWRGTLGDGAALARQVAAGLRERGIGSGDAVAFWLPNCVEAAVVFWGATLAGAAVVPIVHFYGPRELEAILRDSGARLLVTGDVMAGRDGLAVVEALRPGLPALEHVVLVALEGPAPDLGDLATATPIDAPAEADPDEVALLAYTSGTTSTPKGVVHTHRSVNAEITQLAAIQPTGRLPLLVGAPVGHAIGMLSALLLPLHLGDPVHLTDAWDPELLLSAMVEADLNAGSGATYFLTSLLDAPGFGPEHLERMRYVGLGGSPVPAAVTARATELGISVIRSYGSTEHPSTTGATHDDPVARRTRTDGRALPGVELVVVDEQGRPVAPGEAGEIRSRGPDLCAGYTDADLTAAAFDDEGWYATGDVGVLDEDGWLRITDRLSDIIIRGGENVSAAELEELIAQIPGVAEVAVVAAPDERLGERACAFVRPAPDGTVPALAEIQNHLDAAGLARQKWPEEVRAATELPRTPSGKVRKVELREALRREAAG